MSNFSLESFADADALARAVAGQWMQALRSRDKSQPFHVALSGGRITGRFYDEIVAQAQVLPTALTGVHYFWADERCVPPDSPDSNYLLAQERLFAPLQIPATQIHRIHGEASPADAAARAEAEIRRTIPRGDASQPVLDLVFLGMGEDGHVASLFPGQIETDEQARLVFRAVSGPKPPPNRITLTYAALAAAREVWVLASGAGKEAALRESLAPAGQTPLAQVLRSRHITRLFSDIRI